MDMFTVDYSLKLKTNIISGAEMKHNYGMSLMYDADDDEIILYVGSKIIRFKLEDYLYTYDPSDDYEM